MSKFVGGLILGAAVGVVAVLVIQPRTVRCDANHYIVLTGTEASLPDTCSNNAPIIWQAQQGVGDITVKIPDWNGQNPTTLTNPYPGTSCEANTCNSGPFQGKGIATDTAIKYSITFKSSGRKLFAHIIIKP
jgi:hypothetical protein